MDKNTKKAFTLVELLVVISIIALLMSITMPTLAQVRRIAAATVCKSNIRQLALASELYAADNNGNFILAASDIYAPGGNLKRWHGKRSNINEPFDFNRSDFKTYLQDGQIKACPQKVGFVDGRTWDYDFENGSGGYGYNMTYIGSRIWNGGYNAVDKPTRQAEIGNPSRTIIFADAAMAKLDGGAAYFLEYSFVEPPFFVSGGQIQSDWGYSSPSMHFRHSNTANIAWGDGSASDLPPVHFDGINAYGVKSADMQLGWPELTNDLFDLK